MKIKHFYLPRKAEHKQVNKSQNKSKTKTEKILTAGWQRNTWRNAMKSMQGRPEGKFPSSQRSLYIINVAKWFCTMTVKNTWCERKLTLKVFLFLSERKEEREGTSKYTASMRFCVVAVKSNWTTTAPIEAGVLSKGNIQYMQNGYFDMNSLS